jgi:hypothetical protein
MRMLRVNEFSVRPLIAAAAQFSWTGTRQTDAVAARQIHLDTGVHGI